ncbi:hypothetical protein M404DRAFT_516202 [Pisolithus tinctorius Marx 270]|uniref:Uncharacterized protein n=1 Tax=Pisolithus tinctorius Marx 270 TaxID=870435 RepID=A0A0C3J6N9_PISTI|nr:hypothetical protein M404DRAFT_516202 [Pisolithus tinctorius Marx 270]
MCSRLYRVCSKPCPVSLCHGNPISSAKRETVVKFLISCVIRAPFGSGSSKLLPFQGALTRLSMVITTHPVVLQLANGKVSHVKQVRDNGTRQTHRYKTL